MEKYLKMSDVFGSPDVRKVAPTLPESCGAIAANFLYIAHAIDNHDKLVEMNKELITKCEKMQKDSDRWRFVIDAADDMKTSRYETLCSLLNVDVDDDFDLAKQIDIAIGSAV